VGGSSEDNAGQLNVNEAYDPVTNTWTTKAPMPTPRHHHTSEVVNGTLYIIGGRETRVPSSLDSNERYDPKTNTWDTLAPMPTRRSSMVAVYSPVDESIYVFGGEKTKGSFDKNEKYNPMTNKWQVDQPVPTARLGLEAQALHEKIYVIGGKERQAPRSATGINEIFHITRIS
jgi:N-acetylneuraminic acid mutarotase